MSALTFDRRRMRGIKRFGAGMLWISPWLIGFLAWTLYPLLASVYYSFTQYNILQPPRFIGISNFVNLVSEDDNFRLVLGNTLYFTGLGVPAAVVMAFLLATLLNTEVRFRSLFRMVFYLPALVPAIATAEVWRWVYNTNYGLINSTLASMGIAGIPWLSSPRWAKISLIIINCWGQGVSMVIFLAALQDVPRALYDAAKVDGANGLQRWWHVTIPGCTPALLFVLVTSLIYTFQYFTIGWLLTEGNPKFSTEFYSMYLYRNAFVYFKMGYASALAWILFVLICASTILLMRSSRRWAFYRGG